MTREFIDNAHDDEIELGPSIAPNRMQMAVEVADAILSGERTVELACRDICRNSKYPDRINPGSLWGSAQAAQAMSSGDVA